MAEDRKPFLIAGLALLAVGGFMLMRGQTVDPTKPLTIRARGSLHSADPGIDGAIAVFDATHLGVPVLDVPDSSGLIQSGPPGPAATIGFAPWGSTIYPAPGKVQSGPVAFPGQSSDFIPVIWPLGPSGARTAWINRGDFAA